MNEAARELFAIEEARHKEAMETIQQKFQDHKASLSAQRDEIEADPEYKEAVRQIETLCVRKIALVTLKKAKKEIDANYEALVVSLETEQKTATEEYNEIVKATVERQENEDDAATVSQAFEELFKNIRNKTIKDFGDMGTGVQAKKERRSGANRD